MNQASLEKLKTCHKDLQRLIRRVDEIYPVHVICGYRGEEAQNDAFSNGKSQKKYPESKHNKTPSLAVDVVPDPDRDPKTLSWVDLKQYEIMCLAIESAADELKIKIRLGRDFKMKDWPHVELV
jgi:peptidoglycan L-alanyl-D-glutamate endopeptidase CwlK